LKGKRGAEGQVTKKRQRVFVWRIIKSIQARRNTLTKTTTGSVVVEPVDMMDPPTPDTKVGVVIDPSGGVTKKTYGKGEKKTEYLIVDGFYLNPTYYKDWAQMSYWTPHPVITAKWIENKTANSKKRKCWLGCSLLVLFLELINRELEKSGRRRQSQKQRQRKGDKRA